MKIKDSLKLRTFDELTATLESVRTIKDWYNSHKEDRGWINSVYIDRRLSPMAIYLTPSSLDTIIAVLESEIAKLDGVGE